MHIGFLELVFQSICITLLLSPVSYKDCVKGHVCVLRCVQLFVIWWTQPAKLLCPQDFPAKSTRVGCHFFSRCISMGTLNSQCSHSGLLLAPSNIHLTLLSSGGWSRHISASKLPCFIPFIHSVHWDLSCFKAQFKPYLSVAPLHLLSLISPNPDSTRHLTFILILHGILYVIWAFGLGGRQSPIQLQTSKSIVHSYITYS